MVDPLPTSTVVIFGCALGRRYGFLARQVEELARAPKPGEDIINLRQRQICVRSLAEALGLGASTAMAESVVVVPLGANQGFVIDEPVWLETISITRLSPLPHTLRALVSQLPFWGVVRGEDGPTLIVELETLMDSP